MNRAEIECARSVRCGRPQLIWGEIEDYVISDDAMLLACEVAEQNRLTVAAQVEIIQRRNRQIRSLEGLRRIELDELKLR